VRFCLENSPGGAPGLQTLSLYSMTFANAGLSGQCILSPPSVFPRVSKTHTVWHAVYTWKNIFLALWAICTHLLFIWNFLTRISTIHQMAWSGPFYFIHMLEVKSIVCNPGYEIFGIFKSVDNSGNVSYTHKG